MRVLTGIFCVFLSSNFKLYKCLQLGSNSRSQNSYAGSRDQYEFRHSLNIGLIVPFSNFLKKQYEKSVGAAVSNINKKKYNWSKMYYLDEETIHTEMMSINPSPTVILKNLCDTFLKNNVTTIIYMTNSEHFGRTTAASQYFLQLTAYMGIPVISWNADNSGFERRSLKSQLRVQLAPSIEHQVSAMVAIMVRYNWRQFAVVTSGIAGHDDFVQAVREEVTHMREDRNIKFFIQAEVKVTKAEHIDDLIKSETRIILLYATREEASMILDWARSRDLTGHKYVWFVTQSVIGESRNGIAPAKHQFPVGMLGVSFETSSAALIEQIPSALSVFAEAVENFIKIRKNQEFQLSPRLSCMDGASSSLETKWSLGDKFYNFIAGANTRAMNGKPDVKFSKSGTLKNVELNIMNLRQGIQGSGRQWEKIGAWRSWEKDNYGLDIQDIVWPGESHVPPQGVPEKFHITIGFLEEPPFIKFARPDHVTGRCNVDRGIRCRMKNRNNATFNDTSGNMNNEEWQCCSGFCVDLLAKLADDLQFDFDLVRVDDPKWGTQMNGKWNGLMAALIAKQFDMVLTSLKINAEREAVVDFTAPFLESGTSIVVAKRTGIISPTAFLEPFSIASWLITAFVAVQLSALMIFLFEWLSPAGYNMKFSPAPDHKFSLFRTYWLVWALLFQAPVQMDCPRAFTARFMASVWALFAVVFLAIYTANLAAFMITREEWDQFSGIDDPKLSNPQSMKPPLRFGTVPWTYTENAISKHFPDMHLYMKQYNKPNVVDGVNAVKKGDLDAFIYDGTVLDYLVGQDDECKLLTVGSWYAMTGYGLAFPRNSKYFNNFNKKILDYSENGDLERLRHFWLTGTCNPKKEDKRSSEPLAPEQFLSAFFILMCGAALAAGLCSLEHFYFKYLRPTINKTDTAGCCALISLSVGKSLTFLGTVNEARELMKSHQCSDTNCSTQMWKVQQELEAAKKRVAKLRTELKSRGMKSSLPPSYSYLVINR